MSSPPDGAPRRSGQAFTGRFDAITERILPSRLVTHVHLLRHGAVQGMEQRIVRGQLDEPLSTAGRAECAALARWFARNEPRPDVIVASDLARCRELAELVAEACSAPIELDPRLREQSMGRWEGLTWAEITAAEPETVTAYWNDYFHVQPSGGESFQELALRVAKCWEELLARRAGKRVALVTHIGVIRVLLCRALGVPGEEALRFAPATASHTALQVGEAGCVLNALGERPWSFAEASAPSASARASARPKRVALAGSAGTGKTTLGRRLAAELGVPFVEERMRQRLEDGFDVHALTLSDWRALIEGDWEAQRAEEEASPAGSVSDRSSLDYAAFWLHYGLHDDRAATERFLARMFAEARRYDRIVVCPWGGPPIAHDGVRSTNRWTQFRFQAALEGLLDRFADPARVLRLPVASEIEERVARVLA